jgi:small subunit ribosomal protein S20
MPSHKHREKSIRQDVKRQARNSQVKSKLKTLTKKVRADVESGNSEGVTTNLRNAVSAIDKAAKKGTIHKRAASRRISRLAKAANSVKK